MTGETNLAKLIQSMQPELQDGKYVFCTFDSMNEAMKHNPVCTFQEAEGVTAILKSDSAISANISFTSTYAWITLKIHSSLEAVGLTAAFSKALTEANISCNVVAAYYHDHIFVPTKDAEKALGVLKSLAKTTS